MMIADLKGKLTLNELISEDFLTSSVFSVFRYLDKQWIESFINHSVNIKNEQINIKMENPVYCFWPWYPNEQKFGNGAEPDIVIFSGDTALIIEAKNHSGKSAEGVIYESDETEPDILEKKRKVIIDQLGREYFVGFNKILGYRYKQNGKEYIINNFHLIYLTRHSTFPQNEIEDTLKSIEEIFPSEHDNASNNIYWLNWQKAVPILEDIVDNSSSNSFEGIISKELIEFLERRNITHFSGFNFLKNNAGILNETTEDEDYLFYNKIFSVYWNYLDKFKFEKNQVGSVFYNGSVIPF